LECEIIPPVFQYFEAKNFIEKRLSKKREKLREKNFFKKFDLKIFIKNQEKIFDKKNYRKIFSLQEIHKWTHLFSLILETVFLAVSQTD